MIINILYTRCAIGDIAMDSVSCRAPLPHEMKQRIKELCKEVLHVELIGLTLVLKENPHLELIGLPTYQPVFFMFL